MRYSQNYIATVLRLQAQAYDLLKWVSHRSFIDPLLDDRTAAILRDRAQCEAWVVRLLTQVPHRLRPAVADQHMFSRLFASFFQTSFRVEKKDDYGRSYYRIAANKDQAAGKDKLGSRKTPRTLQKKRKNEAMHLRMRSVVELCGDDQMPGFWDRVQELLSEKSLRQEATIWAYAFGLVHRAEGEDDGPAMHRLWKEMDLSVRENLTADRVEQARTAVLSALTSSANR